jgi:hypothetical protein
MEIHAVTSTNVAYVGYNPVTRAMRVTFHANRTYDYFDVAPALFEQMLLSYPWRRIGAMVKRHRYAPVFAA